MRAGGSGDTKVRRRGGARAHRHTLNCVCTPPHTHTRPQATYTAPDLGQFIIDDLNVTAPAGDVIVVRYTIEAPGEAQFGKVLSSSPQPRISVFMWDPQQQDWKIVRWALLHGNNT